jgi:hypothetical protein
MIIYRFKIFITEGFNNMKKILLFFAITALLTACASYTINGQKVSKEEYSRWATQKVKEGIDSRRFAIDVRSMHPYRGHSRQLSSPYSLELRGDSVISYLPYFGEARNIPYGGGKGLNFIGHLYGYEIHQVKSGLWQVMMGVENDEAKYLYVVEVFDNGSSSIHVSTQERDPISFYGEMNLEGK